MKSRGEAAVQGRTLLAVVFIGTLLCSSHAAYASGQRAELSQYGRTLLGQINLYRQEQGLQRLTPDAMLIRLAKTHSFTMFKQKRVNHLHFNERFERSGSRQCVENVGWNYTTPLKQFDAWRRSSGHDQNMLTADLRKAGISEIGGYVTFFACK